MDVGGEERDRGKKRVRTKGLQKKLLEQVHVAVCDPTNTVVGHVLVHAL